MMMGPMSCLFVEGTADLAKGVNAYLVNVIPHESEWPDDVTAISLRGLHLDMLEEAGEEVLKRREDTEYCFAIVLKETGRVIGEIDAEPSDYKPPTPKSGCGRNGKPHS